jgi:hypothetical protein
MGSVANSDVTLPDAVVPKRESSIDRYSSSTVSTPEALLDGPAAEEDQVPTGPAPPPKRKGGRKPVSPPGHQRCIVILTMSRYMLLQKNVNREIAKPKPPFVSDGQSTLNNSRPLSSNMRRILPIYSKAIVLLPTNASC